MTASDDMRAIIVCPRDRSALEWATDVRCESGHRYPIVGGVPVLFGDVDPTGFASETMRLVAERAYDIEAAAQDSGVDPVVQQALVRTNGNLYRHLVGRLPRYPIPEIRLPPGEGRLLLDVGGGWGRWSVAAARAGYRPLLVDPQLELVLAAVRVARQLEVDLTAICGDALALPLAHDTIDTAFSYSVLQHFGKTAARAALLEMRRVVRSGGAVLVQLANCWGLRQLMLQVAESFGTRNTRAFRVRRWSPGEMDSVLSNVVGPSEIEVDGFFSLNVQPTDLDLMPIGHRVLIRSSERLRRWSQSMPLLRSVADSLYVRSTVAKDSCHG